MIPTKQWKIPFLLLSDNKRISISSNVSNDKVFSSKELKSERVTGGHHVEFDKLAHPIERAPVLPNILATHILAGNQESQ